MDATRRIIPSAVDGGPIECFSAGSGPTAVFVIGGGTDVTTYRRAVKRLAERLTVHIYNRRGRGGSAPRPDDYGMATEIGDLSSVLSDAGATRVIGHSVGGLMVLAAARELPIEKAALFDPTVNVDGSFPTDFLPEFERAVAEGRSLDAVAIAGAGLRNPGHQLPGWVQQPLLRAAMATPEGRTMLRLIDTVPAESRLAEAYDGPAGQWSDVRATTRFFIGARSPAYYLPMARAVAAAMPAASVEVIPRLGHDAVARGTAAVMSSLADFLV